MDGDQRCAECVGKGFGGGLESYGHDGLLWCSMCQRVHVPPGVMASMDACDRLRRAIERSQEVWHYWVAVSPVCGAPIMQMSGEGVGAMVTSASSESMAKMLFKAKLGYEVGVMRLSLHGALMSAPPTDEED
jgi:hypothetical protein